MSEDRALKIIVIDDNKAIHQDFIKILSFAEETGFSAVEEELFSGLTPKKSKKMPYFQIDSALQGQEGIKLIKQAFLKNHPYSLAFVDIRMPSGLDGIETIKKIWKIDPEIQIVICTAYSDYTWEETVNELGHKDNLLILKKPFDSIAVRQLAYALTKKWQLLQEQRLYTNTLEKQVADRTSSIKELLSVTRGTLESSADGIIVLNQDYQLVDYNAKFIEMCHIPQSLMDSRQGQLLINYLAEQVDDSEGFLKMVTDLSQNHNLVKISQITFNNDRIYECYTQPYSLNKKVAGRVWSFRNITQRILLEKQLEYQATHDSLTGLPNRALMLDRVQLMMEKARRQNTLFAIIFFDLNRFKLINDSIGHDAGDGLLKIVAERLKFMLRKSDTLARLGGDEFIVLVDGLNEEADAGNVAAHLLEAFDSHFDVAGQSLSVSASAGISIYPRDGKSIGDLLRHADAAMYEAKKLGGNQFQFYTTELGGQIKRRLQLENELYNAMTNHEFVLYYQPQFDIATQKISSIEALIRWNHPQKGLLLPIHFISAAEDIGLDVPIGEWVLKTACKQNKKWQDAGYPPMRIAVNISSNQIRQLDFVQFIKKTLDSTGLNPVYLELEITENTIISNIKTAHRTLLELSSMGINITLDDFGTGNSSINYLKEIPLDRLKIDQSFISNINLNTTDEVIIQSIISLARNLNLKIVAEGIETKKQLNFLQSNHCEVGQGFYFSEPVPQEAIERIMSGNNKNSRKNN